MIDLSKVQNYYVACGYTDLRRGIDGLASIIIQQYGGQLDEESLFLFSGQTGSRRSTGREMDIFCYTSVCRMDGFSGQGVKQNCG